MFEYFTPIKDVAPWVAMIISVAALIISILAYRRDRADLKAISTFFLDWEGFHASLTVKVVNAGRRPIILIAWTGAEVKRNIFGRMKIVNCAGTYFNTATGLTLGEGQSHSFKLEAHDLVDNLPNGEVIVINNLWIDDSLGRRHMVKDVRKNIAQLWAWKTRQASIRKVS